MRVLTVMTRLLQLLTGAATAIDAQTEHTGHLLPAPAYPLVRP